MILEYFSVIVKKYREAKTDEEKRSIIRKVHTLGRMRGEERGLKDGFEEGYDDGKKNGYSQGYSERYGQGYNYRW